jgi:hypothetical protein
MRKWMLVFSIIFLPSRRHVSMRLSFATALLHVIGLIRPHPAFFHLALACSPSL